MYCKKCGKQIDDNSDFCPKCGSSQKETSLNPNTSSKPSGKGKLPLIIFLIATLFSPFLRIYCYSDIDSFLDYFDIDSSFTLIRFFRMLIESKDFARAMYLALPFLVVIGLLAISIHSVYSMIQMYINEPKNNYGFWENAVSASRIIMIYNLYLIGMVYILKVLGLRVAFGLGPTPFIFIISAIDIVAFIFSLNRRNTSDPIPKHKPNGDRPTPPITDIWTCPECGDSNPRTSRQCRGCGYTK